MDSNQRNELMTLIVGMFDGAPTAAIFNQLIDQVQGGESIESLMNSLVLTDEFQSLYSDALTNDEFSTAFVTAILAGNASDEALQEGIEYVAQLLAEGTGRGEALYTAIKALSSVEFSDEVWGKASQNLLNKISVAQLFADITEGSAASYDLEALRNVLNGISSDLKTVSNKKAILVSTDSVSSGITQRLTLDEDALSGTAWNDIFIAEVLNGQNTAQTGDSVFGGGGEDILIVDLEGAPELQLTASSLESAHFRINSENTENDTVVINAENMTDTKEFWAIDNQGDLRIEAVQNDSHLTTVGWRNSAGGADYEVYFNNATAGINRSSSQVWLEIMDLEGMKDEGVPLLNNPYTKFEFMLGGISVQVDIAIKTSYEDLVDQINLDLKEQGVDLITASLSKYFGAAHADNGIVYYGRSILLTNSGPEYIYPIAWHVDGLLAPGSNVKASTHEIVASLATRGRETNVVLDFVGSGEKGGDLIIGGVSSGDDEEGFYNDIQRLNIEVDGNSWLNTIESSYSALDEIYLKNIGAEGSFCVDRLVDINHFDASEMTNDVSMNTTISEAFLEKYSAEYYYPTFFNYFGGKGNDTYILNAVDSEEAIDNIILKIEMDSGDDNVSIGSDIEAEVNPGQGDDRIELIVDRQAITKFVYADRDIGNDTIVNFNGAGLVPDQLDFTYFLADLASEETNYFSLERVETKTNPIVSLQENGVELGANETVILNGFEASGIETWSELTGSKLLSAINSSNLTGEDDYGNIDRDDLDASSWISGLVSDERNNIVMVENDSNAGEYKVFHLISDNSYSNRNGDFNSAELLGVIDVGESITSGNVFS